MAHGRLGGRVGVLWSEGMRTGRDDDLDVGKIVLDHLLEGTLHFVSESVEGLS